MLPCLSCFFESGVEVYEFGPGDGKKSNIILNYDLVTSLPAGRQGHYRPRAVFDRFFDKFAATVRSAGLIGVNRVLNDSLKKYLDSPAINDRTDDDKSLIVAVRL